MAQMVGADVARLEALGVRMHSSADELDRIRTSVTALLTHTRWGGRDADAFRHEWHSRLIGQLADVAGRTRDAGVTVRAEAEQQRAAGQAGGTAWWAGPSATGTPGFHEWMRALVDGREHVDWALDTLDGAALLAGAFGLLSGAATLRQHGATPGSGSGPVVGLRVPGVQPLPDLVGRVGGTSSLVAGDQHAARGDADERGQSGDLPPPHVDSVPNRDSTV